MVKSLEFGSSQQAWEGINEYMANQDKEVTERGGNRYGPELVSYNHYIYIRKAWMDPELDLGLVLGYTRSKWTSLVNNYVDMDHLDLVKSMVREKEAKKSRSYNLSMLFDNSHNSGKGCLLSLTFSRRLDKDHPILTFNLRASEITKRLPFDLVLVQRIGEYVYGPDEHIAIQFFSAHIYLSAEAFSMYENHKEISSVVPNETPWHQKIHDTLKHMQTTDPALIKYKVHKRCALQLQFCEEGKPLSKKPSMKVKP